MKASASLFELIEDAIDFLEWTEVAHQASCRPLYTRHDIECTCGWMAKVDAKKKLLARLKRAKGRGA